MIIIIFFELPVQPKVIIKLLGSKYLRDGSEYVKVEKLQVSIKANGYRTYFDNLFRGQKTLEMAANQVINDNIELIANEALPSVIKLLEEKIMKVGNLFLEKGTYDEFFP